MFAPDLENILETRTCRISGEQFEITQADLDFYDTVSPIFGGKKYSLPAPTLSPNQRMRRRMTFRNFMNLYGRKSSFSGKTMLSMYRPDSDYIVYSNEEWWSDGWDQHAHVQEFDSSKTMNEQFALLHTSTPRMGLMRSRCENCDYVNLAIESKNCYLVFGCLRNEDCIYGHIIWRSNNCYDCLYIYGCENLYECIDCVDSQRLFWSSNCQDCSDGYFLDHCIDCQDCFGCIGLRHKQYCIFNEQHSKQDYEQKISELTTFRPEIQEFVLDRMNDLRSSVPHCSIHEKNTSNVTGDYIHYSSNAINSYDLKNCENVSHCATLDGFTNCHDCMFSAGPADHCYENIFAYGSNLLFNHDSTNENRNLIYCTSCHGCQDCFGCANLKKAKNCFLNKPYSRHEYEKLGGAAIDHMSQTEEWGEFFHPSVSAFGYNESIAYQYFPASKEEIDALGWNWVDRSELPYTGEVYEPGDISDYTESKVGIEKARRHIDACLKGVLKCEDTGRPYKIVRQELLFYIENGIPIPKKHPDKRHEIRMGKRNPRKLWERSCPDCQTVVSTTYAPDRSEYVVCGDCYHSSK